MEIRKMSQSELDKAIKEELERAGVFMLAEEGLERRGGIGAGASGAEQGRAVSRCVHVGRRVSRHIDRAVLPAGTRALQAVLPARAQRLS
jgi:hypothetical protein